jgi:hypothetical protein
MDLSTVRSLALSECRKKDIMGRHEDVVGDFIGENEERREVG